MKKTLIYTVAGTLISFLINHFVWESEGLWLDIFYAFAFGAAWGMSYFLDREDFSLPQKLGISFGGMLALVMAGVLFFPIDKALPAVFKFSIVFVGYYLLASFRSSKSLRS